MTIAHVLPRTTAALDPGAIVASTAEATPEVISHHATCRAAALAVSFAERHDAWRDLIAPFAATARVCAPPIRL